MAMTAWSATTHYHAGDKVTRSGKTWRAEHASLNDQPPGRSWEEVAATEAITDLRCALEHTSPQVNPVVDLVLSDNPQQNQDSATINTLPVVIASFADEISGFGVFAVALAEKVGVRAFYDLVLTICNAAGTVWASFDSGEIPVTVGEEISNNVDTWTLSDESAESGFHVSGTNPTLIVPPSAGPWVAQLTAYLYPRA